MDPLGEKAEALGKGGLLTRGMGTWQATALNVTFVVGAGVFATIPLMLCELPGPYALLGWLAAGALVFVDGLIWSELGATLPGSGGSYLYLLECFGRERWGRLFAFLFIWQFLLSGPLELGSGLVAAAGFSTALNQGFGEFNQRWTWTYELWPDRGVPGQGVTVAVGPARLLAVGLGLGIIVLLYRSITTLGRLTVTFWLGVMAAIAWVLVEGWVRFDPAVAFDFSGAAAGWPSDFGWKLGPAMIVAIYSYLGYYNVCYVGDEVRDPGRNIPRAVLASVLIVCTLFVTLHLAMLGTVPWQEVAGKDVNLAAVFMEKIHGSAAATAVTVLLIWCVIGSVFAGMLGYSRIPYGAARRGHFFGLFSKVHATQHIPHRSLLLVGALTLSWSFFDLQSVINALIVTRILEQFVAQAVGVILLRRNQPDRPRPFRMWLYPLPSLLALVGWLYVYGSSGWLYIGLGAATLAAGVVVFLVWSRRAGGWPFTTREPQGV
jgi:amino acid transporter